MSDFIIVMGSGRTYGMNFDEMIRFKKKRSTTGKQYPIFKLDNGSEIAIDRVEALEVDEYVKPERVQPTVTDDYDRTLVDCIDDKMNKMEESKPDAAALRRVELEKKFMAKSNCTHKDVSLHFHDTKKGKRFFPVCDFCGHRGRYIGTTKLSDEEQAEAIEYNESQKEVARI